MFIMLEKFIADVAARAKRRELLLPADGDFPPGVPLFRAAGHIASGLGGASDPAVRLGVCSLVGRSSAGIVRMGELPSVGLPGTGGILDDRARTGSLESLDHVAEFPVPHFPARHDGVSGWVRLTWSRRAQVLVGRFYSLSLALRAGAVLTL